MNFDFSKQRDKKLAIKEKMQTSLIRYDEIVYLECTSNLVFVYHTKDEAPLSYSNSLAHIEKELLKYGFMRINDNMIINMYRVQKLISKKHEILVSNDKNLSISRRKWKK
jgi:DNA-binding LytR/AlgR family response regulator